MESLELWDNSGYFGTLYSNCVPVANGFIVYTWTRRNKTLAALPYAILYSYKVRANNNDLSLMLTMR